MANCRCLPHRIGHNISTQNVPSTKRFEVGILGYPPRNMLRHAGSNADTNAVQHPLHKDGISIYCGDTALHRFRGHLSVQTRQQCPLPPKSHRIVLSIWIWRIDRIGSSHWITGNSIVASANHTMLDIGLDIGMVLSHGYSLQWLRKQPFLGNGILFESVRSHRRRDDTHGTRLSLGTRTTQQSHSAHRGRIVGRCGRRIPASYRRRARFEYSSIGRRLLENIGVFDALVGVNRVSMR
mmetsp:Transcript_11056/g.23624  ORF Transcript_11056/g.23624 Transcript_11056/m.23624 type:complete len:238 (+) Transcript_11056:301-1014(+)